jgi:peroxiredoxin|tara:strand:- start:80008 stop:80484 length:477 start_codon:yes stop_codon:yes gene_type:complete
MTISIGEKLPSLTLKTMGAEGPEEITTGSIFDGKKVVLFALPGAFTPGCSNTHMPGFVVEADAIKAKGVDSIVCLAVNDAFVMSAWGETQNADQLLLVADGSCAFTSAIGMALDLTAGGLGIRSQRYAMIVNNGVVEAIELDQGSIEKSTAEAILELL